MKLQPEMLWLGKYVHSKAFKNDGRVRGRDRECKEVWISSTNEKERPDVSMSVDDSKKTECKNI